MRKPSIQIGDEFAGRYEIVDKLGSGASTTVYVATDETLGRKVALKILDLGPSRETLDDPETLDRWVKRFEREARVVSRLKDPNTVTIHDFGEHDDEAWYIAFEYVDGRGLDEIVEKDGALAPERVVRIARQILQSLREAHSEGVLHRDIKPANIMLFDRVERDDWVKVLDFGIAKPTEIGEDDRTVAQVTDEQVILGTPRYMAPEQARREELTPATDLYALGLVLWELLVGESTIQKQDTIAILARQVSAEKFVLPRSVGVPEELREIIHRLIAKDPAGRYQSADEVLEALDNLTFGAELEADPFQPADEDGEIVAPLGDGESLSELADGGDPPARTIPDSDAVQRARDEILEGTPDATRDRSTRAAEDPLQEARKALLEEEESTSLETDESSVAESEEEASDPTAVIADEADEVAAAATVEDPKTDPREARPEIPTEDIPTEDRASRDLETEEETGGGAMETLREFGRRAIPTGPGARTVFIGGAVAAVVAVLVFVGRGSGWVEWGGDLVDDGVDALQGLATGSGADYTNTGIFEAVATSRWEPVGKSSFVEIDGERRAIRTYEWDDNRMRVEIVECGSKSKAVSRTEGVEAPNRAVRFGTKAVLLRLRGDGEPLRLREAETILTRYREMLDE